MKVIDSSQIITASACANFGRLIKYMRNNKAKFDSVYVTLRDVPVAKITLLNQNVIAKREYKFYIDEPVKEESKKKARRNTPDKKARTTEIEDMLERLLKQGKTAPNSIDVFGMTTVTTRKEES